MNLVAEVNEINEDEQNDTYQNDLKEIDKKKDYDTNKGK